MSHAVILEITEEGREQHSKARAIPDAERELQTRAALASIPILYIYLIVANNTYHNAHADDIFFTKCRAGERKNEYMIIKGRKEAFKDRLRNTLQVMIEGHQQLSNETVWIGH